MKRASWNWLLALFLVAMVAASCTGDEATTTTEGEQSTATTEVTEGEATSTEATQEVVDLVGTRVTVFGPESSDEAGAIIDALALFTSDTGIEVTYTGARDFSGQINAQVAAGTPPDIAIYPQPGKLADFARDGFILPVPDAVVAASAWDGTFLSFGKVDGVQYAMPNKADLKSLVWYKPKSFADKGYTVPETFTEFVGLVETMAADGNTPLCIDSGPATGRTFADWTEEMVLRFEGADVYDKWVSHEIPFNDPRIVGQMQAVIDLWDPDSGNTTFASESSIETTTFGAGDEPLVNGDCMMHRQASSYGTLFPEGTAFADGTQDAVDVFYLPSDTGRPVLGAGTHVGAHNDRPEVWAVMEYFGSVEYADARQAAQVARRGGGLSGFLSAAKGADVSLYSDLEKSFLDILASAETLRFDASDLMPTDVGSGTLWTEGTAAVNGEKSVQGAADAIEASWPS